MMSKKSEWLFEQIDKHWLAIICLVVSGIYFYTKEQVSLHHADDALHEKLDAQSKKLLAIQSALDERRDFMDDTGSTVNYLCQKDPVCMDKFPIIKSTK